MKSVAALTIGSSDRRATGSAAARGERVHAGRGRVTAPAPTASAPLDSPAMSRLTDPVYRRRALRVRRRRAARGAAPSRSPSSCASSTTRGRHPGPLRDDARGLDRLRRDRQGARVRALRPAPAVVALLPAPRPLAAGPRAGGRQRAPGRCVFVLAKPYADSLPRSVVVFDFLLTCLPARRRPARSPDRSPSARARRAAPRRARGVLVVGAGSGGQMVVRELQLNPNLGARAIGFLDDDPRKRGMRAVGLKVLGHHRRDRRRSSTSRARTR